MNQMQTIASKIPHEYRVKILMIWLPKCKIKMSDEFYKNLWNMYFIYIDPNGVKKPNCPTCLQNVYDNWVKMKPDLVEAEQQYRMLEQL